VIHDAVEAIDAAVRAEMVRSRQPGLTIGLTDADETVAVRTYGFADLAAQAPVTRDTLFEIGSIGKSFTAVAALQLVDEGRLELDAPVVRYLPWFALPARPDDVPVTVAHLLCHTGGIVAGIDATPEAAFQVWALRDLPRHSPPGERFHYSNVGYKALGLVLEAIERRTYREVVQQRILDPLGMNGTEAAITHDIRTRLAVGYAYLHDDRLGHPSAPLAPAAWLETATADGSLASTASDMCAFVRLLLRRGAAPSGRLLSDASFELMATGHVRDDDGGEYGYGLSIRDLDGRRWVGHGGGMVGYAAGMETDPAAGIGAIVLQNGPGARPLTLARTAVALALEARNGTPSRAAPGRAEAPTPAGHVGGRYVPDDPDAAPLELVVDAQPAVRLAGRQVALEPLEEGLFLAADAQLDEFPIRIDPTAGEVQELWHGARRYTREGATGGRPAEPAAELRAIVGRYRSHNPWTTNFRVLLRGEEPWLFFASPPDGFSMEQPLVPRPDGSFQVGVDSRNPESLRFDSLADGRALRAWLSGWAYYRAD
jgi:CubicO group peptidase (beta-lactamase class C family)